MVYYKSDIFYLEPVPADLPDGSIDELKKPEDIREEPLTLPKNYEWFDVDIFNDEQVYIFRDLLIFRLIKYMTYYVIIMLKMMIICSDLIIQCL